MRSTMTDGLSLPEDNCATGPNCGVTAVAIAAGISFAQAWDLLRNGRNANWKGRTNEAERNKALTALGVKLVPVGIGRRASLKTVARLLNPDHRYLVRTTGHVQILGGGLMVDQRGARPVDGAVARKIVRSVYRIER